MLTKEQIEWGKQNKTAWGWLTEEEKEIFNEAQKKHKLKRLISSGMGVIWCDVSCNFYLEEFSNIYRIDPSYKSKETYRAEKCPIITKSDNLIYYVRGDESIIIDSVLAEQDYSHSVWEDGSTSIDFRRVVKGDDSAPAEIAKYVVFAVKE